MRLRKRKTKAEESISQETNSVSGGDDYSEVTHPIFSFSGFNSRQKTIVIVIVFAVVGSILTYAANAAQISSEESVRLSNGTQIRLGDSTQVIEAKLGDKFHKLSERQYLYPGHPERPIEVVMDIEDGEVVVIHIVSNRSNALHAAQGTFGTDLRQMILHNRRARPAINELAQLRREQALLIKQSRSTQYYIPEPCSETGLTDLVSLVKEGYEHRLIEDMAGDSCGRD